MMIDRPVCYTMFPDQFAQNKIEAEFTLCELAKEIISTKEPTKALLPFVKAARFADKPSSKGCLRHNGNIKSITGVEVDYDFGDVAFEDACVCVEQAGIIALLYTTPSHMQPGKGPRWRIIAPFSKELEGSPEALDAARKQSVARLNGLFDGKLAPESFVVSQAFYVGGTFNGTPVSAFVTEGERTIDMADYLDAGAVGRQGREWAQEDTDGSEQKKAFGGDLALLEAAVMAVPITTDANNGRYHNWLAMGFAIHFETQGSEEGFGIWDRWSRQDADTYENAKVPILVNRR
jgi:hypothetical protein